MSKKKKEKLKDIEENLGEKAQYMKNALNFFIGQWVNDNLRKYGRIELELVGGKIKLKTFEDSCKECEHNKKDHGVLGTYCLGKDKEGYNSCQCFGGFKQ